MIQNIVRAPTAAADWDSYSFSHMTSHAKMIDAVRARTGVHLPTYDLHPIVANDWDGWLNRNQQAHIDLFSALRASVPGIQGMNLGFVDTHNKEDFQRWTMNHWMQHRDLESFLGIGS